jgi:competence protein ComEC
MGEAIVWCLAYIVGLLATGVKWGSFIALGCGAIAAVILPKVRRGYPLSRSSVWLVAGIIAFSAGFYLQVRSPQPGPQDISRFVPDQKQEMTVYGQVEELPRLTRSGKSRFWLNVTGLKANDAKVDGKLYVTVENKNAIDLYPGKAISITGSLYQPKPAMNPGGFDFQKYLAREGSFAGLKGEKIQIEDLNQKPQFGWWMIQQRIVRSQAEKLGDRKGALLSAMVLGNRSVDIPFDIKEAFQRAGLSHALAASGFQVSLILGIVLAATRRFSKTVQLSCGAAGLLVFGGLAGLQPAVSRAILMGFAVLAGIGFERKVRPVGSLLVAATILLFIVPAWIWDIGFQLSFLATLGLLVTSSAVEKRLDWLPNIIAPAISVPIAAYIWTLPLQLYYFGIVSPYSIFVNVLTTLLISILSIGGMISALLALISPVAGSFSAWTMDYPLRFLLEIVNFFCKLPGNSFAVGIISVTLMLGLYVLICLPWIRPQVQRFWGVLLIVGMSLVFVPATYAHLSSFKVTAIAAPTPILIIQDHGKIGLINTGDATTASLSVVPFLQKQGINKIDWAIAVNSADSWETVTKSFPIRSIYDVSDPKKPANVGKVEQHTKLVVEESVRVGAIAVRPLSLEPTILQLELGRLKWLWLQDVPNIKQRKMLGEDLVGHQVLWWSGRKLHPELLEILKPEGAIAYASIRPEMLAQLQQQGVAVYSTAQDGALEWTPEQGFKMFSEMSESEAALL